MLKDLGCSSNAARICELYDADDRAFKQGYKTVGTSLAATLHFVFSKTARGKPLHRRAAAIGNILTNGGAIAQELILSRCTRGAEIARSLKFPESVCEGIYRLDEHWDGSGRPGGLHGRDIPLYRADCAARAGRRRVPSAMPGAPPASTRSAAGPASGSIRTWCARSSAWPRRTGFWDSSNSTASAGDGGRAGAGR